MNHKQLLKKKIQIKPQFSKLKKKLYRQIASFHDVLDKVI